MSSDSARGNSGWVTTKVAAEALGVGPRMIRTYIRRGDLEAKTEGKGVEKAYLVSIDSVYALRNARKASGKFRGKNRQKSAGDEGSAELAELLRDLTAQVVEKGEEAARLRERLQLTEETQSTLEARAAALEEERDRLRAELEEERSKGFWRRLFGG